MTGSARCFALAGIVAVAACSGFHPEAPNGAPTDARFAQVEGVPLRYIDVGSGPAVVLIHGFASSLDVWRGIVPELAKGHRVIALDLKGFGFSGRPAGDYSPAAQARLVRGLLDQRGVDRAAVVAHSWGAGVALALALDAPGRVERLVLYSAYVYDEQVPPFYQWAQLPGMGEALFALYYQHGLEDRIGLAFYDQRQATQERVEIVEAEARRPGTTAAALAAVRGQRYARLAARYSTIKVPTLLLWGENDIVTSLRFGHRLERELGNARLVSYARCGHMPMFEAARPSTRELLRFLGGGGS